MPPHQSFQAPPSRESLHFGDGNATAPGETHAGPVDSSAARVKPTRCARFDLPPLHRPALDSFRLWTIPVLGYPRFRVPWVEHRVFDAFKDIQHVCPGILFLGPLGVGVGGWWAAFLSSFSLTLRRTHMRGSLQTWGSSPRRSFLFLSFCFFAFFFFFYFSFPPVPFLLLSRQPRR